MIKNFEQTGILSIDDLVIPRDDQLEKGVAISECIQLIPCNPCVDICPFDAISMEDINAVPVVDFKKCTGCGKCISICPGLAIFVVKIKDDKAFITLPYEFLPITNVYTFYNVGSALESVIPSVESFFYSTTTQNNCFPSLHTAMTILVAYSVSLTGNKKLMYFSYFTMISVIISVIYLSIHWVLDVISGALLTIGVILILRRYMKE